MMRKIRSADEFVEEFIYYRYTHPVRRKILADGIRRKSGPPKKLTASSEQLREMYVGYGITAKKIGQLYGVHENTVRRMLKRYGITKE